MTHEEIAQMIGSSRETVTRLLSELKKRELIRLEGSTLGDPQSAGVGSAGCLAADCSRQGGRNLQPAASPFAIADCRFQIEDLNGSSFDHGRALGASKSAI